MTNSTRTTASEHRPESDASRSMRTPALVAGLGILLMAFLAGFGNFVAVEGLVTPGDAARTADDILAAETTFRLGVLSLYLVVVLDVVVAWALMRVLSPVSQSLSRLAAWFRLAYAGVFLVAISQLAGVPDLVKTQGSAFSAEQLEAQALQKIDTFNDIWFASLVLFAVHLVLVGYLAHRSGYVPKILGVLVVVAGLGYAFDSVGTVLSESPPLISTVTFLGEFLLCLWLLIKGRRLSVGMDHHAI
jgi:hypothetical protein